MNEQITSRNGVKSRSLFYTVAIIGVAFLVNACHKNSEQNKTVAATQNEVVNQALPISDGEAITSVVNVAAIRKSGDGTKNKVMFDELAEMFSVDDNSILTTLQDALNGHKTLKITIDPWKGSILKVSPAASAQRKIVPGPNTGRKIDLAHMNTDVINTPPEMAVINTTTAGLTNVVPDMATAQLMFDYITHQCCALPGPYDIDYCIPFQYCEDGCYARAHKMCWIINNRYRYATHKIFSFANDLSGVDELCVKAEKWGGCCVNWWYHVAPLVNIKTPSGTKAYVFDPAMFDKPVLLASWLHAQQNPDCVPSGDVPHVTMINIQPTTSYWPSDYTGYAFDTDPLYVSTNYYLNHYEPLTTCH